MRPGYRAAVRRPSSFCFRGVTETVIERGAAPSLIVTPPFHRWDAPFDGDSMLKQAIALVLLMTASGCATLFSSSTSNVALTSSPTGAAVYIDGSRAGETPTIVELENHTSYTIVFRSSDGGEASCRLNRRVGAGWVILDILGGLIPVIIDAATGAWYGLDSRSCDVNLRTDGMSLDLRTEDLPPGTETVWIMPAN